MTTGKTTVMIIRTFVSRVISLLFNTLSRFVSFPAKKQSSSDFMAAVTVVVILFGELRSASPAAWPKGMFSYRNKRRSYKNVEMSLLA